MARREPEAEHRGREEGGHDELSTEHRRAQVARELDPPQLGQCAVEPVAVGAPQVEQADEDEEEDGRPAEEPVVAVDEESDQPVRALEVAERERRVRGGLARHVGRVRGGTPVERLVEGHVQRHAEESRLDRADGERAPACAPERPRGDPAHHDARRHELRAEPRERAEQREAAERRRDARPLAEPKGEQDRPRDRRAGRELRVDRGAVGDERRTEADRRSRAERPRVGYHAERHAVRERHRERGDGGHQELDAGRPGERVGRRDQRGEAHAVRLVEATLRLPAVAVELVWVPVAVGAPGVLVPHVHVAVVDQRLGRQQVVRLVAAVL